MLLLVLAVIAGFTVRPLVPPTASGLHLRGVFMLVGALCVQAFVAPRISGWFHSILLFGSVLVGIGWLVFNIAIARTLLVRTALLAFAVGAVMNLIPTLQYGSMPVDRTALLRSGIRDAQIADQPAQKHVLVVGDAPFLSDRIPIPQLHMVASPGDFVEVLGVIGLVAAWPRSRKPVDGRAARRVGRRRPRTIQS